MKRTGLAAAAVALALLAGCGPRPGATVSGAVTYDDAPVKKGTITFTPADGKGQATGAEIADGKYRVADVPPGPKTVMIAAVEDAGGPVSTEDLKNAGTDPRKKAAPVGIPPNAVGNGATLDVGTENLTKNFDLKKPGSK